MAMSINYEATHCATSSILLSHHSSSVTPSAYALNTISLHLVNYMPWFQWLHQLKMVCDVTMHAQKC
jgi:hypothetical protein